MSARSTYAIVSDPMTRDEWGDAAARALLDRLRDDMRAAGDDPDAHPYAVTLTMLDADPDGRHVFRLEAVPAAGSIA